MKDTIEILYDGFVEYEKRIKGYHSVPSLAQIREWEEWMEIVVKAIEKNKVDRTPSLVVR